MARAILPDRPDGPVATTTRAFPVSQAGRPWAVRHLTLPERQRSMAQSPKGSGTMGFDVIYAVGTILFTIGGWELGKRVWTAKGADPRCGKRYGVFLGSLFGLFGALTLLAISWRWHPASEPRGPGDTGASRRTRTAGAGLTTRTARKELHAKDADDMAADAGFGLDAGCRGCRPGLDRRS